MKAIFATIAAVLVNMAAADSIGVCRNQVFFTDPTVDFLFVIDRSGSMRSKIEGIASGFKKFRQLIADSSLTSTRFAVVRYGGKPRIYLPFTEDNDDFVSAVNEVQKRNSGGQEAAFEAIRGSLPPENGKKFLKSCATKYKNVCQLSWRPGALKVIILATDENSDWPTLAAYRVEGQESRSSVFQSYEPAFEPAVEYRGRMYRYSKALRLTEPWELELKTTAQALLDNNAFVNLLVNPQGLGEGESLFNRRNAYWWSKYRRVQNAPTSDSTVSIIQFCHPYLQVQDNEFNNYNPDATLSLLKAQEVAGSVQGRLLEAGGFARCYDINFFRTGGEYDKVIESFYESLIKSATSIVETCEFPPVTATQTSLPTFASAPLATETSTGDNEGTVNGVFVGSEDGEDGEGGEISVDGEEGGEAGVIEVTVGEGEEGSDATGSVAELNADGTSTNAVNGTSSTVYIGGATAFVVAFAAIGGLIVQRRTVRAKQAEDAMTQFDGTQNTNPLYDGQSNGNNENPLYVGRSNQELDKESGEARPDFLQSADV